ncbi:DUF1293 family protein [Vibrio bivalvicida]|uniref:Phage integrase n=2 Tax=Vibrionaceae TaxID=641 RepID=A0A0H3ZW67_9GAMM|nr:Phage integrase [Enterovibrio norvegicus]
MKKGLFVLGITFLEEQRGKQARLNISRPLKDLDTGTFKREVYGETGEVSEKYDTPILLDLTYAELLRSTGALVPRREYEVETAFDYDNPLEPSKVVKLIPVDKEIKDHFDASLKSKQG